MKNYTDLEVVKMATGGQLKTITNEQMTELCELSNVYNKPFYFEYENNKSYEELKINDKVYIKDMTTDKSFTIAILKYLD